jgi:hypothetical protein
MQIDLNFDAKIKHNRERADNKIGLGILMQEATAQVQA